MQCTASTYEKWQMLAFSHGNKIFLLVICSRSAIILTVLETRYVYVENYAQSSKKTICGRLKQSDIVNINNLLIGDLNICLGIDSLCLPTSYNYRYFVPTYFDV